MNELNSVEKMQTNDLADKIRMPVQSHKRDNFYKTTENVRYYLKFNLTNGQQAEDIPIGIEHLIEFIGDVEMLLNSTKNITVRLKIYDSWNTKLHSEETYLENIDWKTLESSIESLAKEHGLPLKKSICMSGRGYKKEGYRCVVVSYSFGTYSLNEKDRIKNKNMPLCNIKWVGGKIGKKENLKESTIKIKSTRKICTFESYYKKFVSYLKI